MHFLNFNNKAAFGFSILTAILLVACSGGSSSTTPAATYPGITEYLTINPTVLLNYAAPALPVHYDAAVMAATNDNPANALTDKGG